MSSSDLEGMGQAVPRALTAAAACCTAACHVCSTEAGTQSFSACVQALSLLHSRPVPGLSMLVCLHKPGGERVLVAGFQVLSPFFSLFFLNPDPICQNSLHTKPFCLVSPDRECTCAPWAAAVASVKKGALHRVGGSCPAGKPCQRL